MSGRGAVVAVSLLGLLSAAALLPDLVGLDATTPFAQVVAFRPALAVGLLVLVLAVAATRHPTPRVTAALLVVPVAALALTVPRAVPDPAPPGAADLVVLTLNTYAGRADPRAVADLVRVEHPDLITLVEAGTRFSEALRAEPAAAGYRSFTATGHDDQDVNSVTVLVAPAVGAVRLSEGRATLFPYLEVTGGGLGSLRYIAFHGAAPIPAIVPAWRRDLERVGPWCDGSSTVVVTGDFNASLDHSVLRDRLGTCSDAAATTGDGLVGTWPAWVPPFLGAQIDHVLYSADRLHAVRTRVVSVPGSDHRAVVAELARRTPG